MKGRPRSSLLHEHSKYTAHCRPNCIGFGTLALRPETDTIPAVVHRSKPPQVGNLVHTWHREGQPPYRKHIRAGQSVQDLVAFFGTYTLEKYTTFGIEC